VRERGTESRFGAHRSGSGPARISTCGHDRRVRRASERLLHRGIEWRCRGWRSRLPVFHEGGPLGCSHRYQRTPSRIPQENQQCAKRGQAAQRRQSV